MTNTLVCSVLAQFQPNNPGQVVFLAVLAIIGIVSLLVLLLFVRVFLLWLQSFFAGARISIVAIVAMMVRRTSPANVVRFRIMAVQAGLDVRTAQIESAILQGIDVETALLAMIHGRQTGTEVTWQEATAEDVKERLRKKLFDT